MRAGGARKILEAEEIADKADEVIETEETFVELNVEAILEAAERVEIVRDIAAEGVEAVLKAAERVKEFIVEPFVEAIRDKAAEESRLYVRPLKEVEGPGIESRPH